MNKPYIIAEIGLNHNGNLKLAKKMIEIAKQCGADCVKFQLFHTDLICEPEYQPELFEKLTNCQLTETDMLILRLHCKKKGIDFLCTPDDLESAVFLNKIQDKFKISSVGAANLHLLRLINTFKKPVLISNGLISKAGEKIAEDILKDCKVTWMTCVPKYPATEQDYYYYFEHKGLSDHTLGISLALEAAEEGMEVIEKHFTLDKTSPGFDHHMSIEPHELKELCERIKDV